MIPTPRASAPKTGTIPRGVSVAAGIGEVSGTTDGIVVVVYGCTGDSRWCLAFRSSCAGDRYAALRFVCHERKGTRFADIGRYCGVVLAVPGTITHWLLV